VRTNRYLSGIVWTPKYRASVWVFWVAVVVLAMAISTWLLGSSRAPQMPLLVALCAIVILALTLRQILRRTAGPKVAEAEALVLRERFDEAVPALRMLLPRTSGYERYRVLIALGSCASMKGDFAEAAEVYATASRVSGGALGQMLAPNAHAAAAFALAAAGRLDDAERALAWAASGPGMPSTRAAVARARALLLSKRGQQAAVTELVAAERLAIRNSLPRRDRVLLRVLATTPPGHVRVEPEIARWIALVVSERREIWEGA
jgi:hypothetical protein